MRDRLRRLARHKGLALAKSRSRTPGTYDYGTYLIVDASTNWVVSPERMNLDDVEAFLTAEDD